MKFKSQVYTQASGSIGGITYSHNKGGMYTRARATPTNPNTARQQAVRGAMGGMVNMWNTLSDANRETWRLYASNTPVLNKLGDMITLSGQQMFNRTNAFRDGVTAMLDPSNPGLAAISTGPTTFNTGEPILAITATTFATGNLVLDLDIAAPASDDGDVVLFAGRPQNPGVQFYKGPYQMAAVEAIAAMATTTQFDVTDVTDPIDWASEYLPDVGVWQPIRVVIAYDDGRISQTFRDFILPIAPA